MKKLILVLSLMTTHFLPAQDLPVYSGNDLGLTYTPQQSTFKVWSPMAKTMTLRFYKTDLDGTADETVTMQRGDSGVWQHTAVGNLKGRYYTFQVETEKGDVMKETTDPYAKAVGANGKRAQVIDIQATNPKGWASDKSPKFSGKATDAILYELHIRDATIDASSGVKNKGKYLGLTEKKTTYTEGGVKVPTALEHIKQLGVTHVHLLPTFDYASIDETQLDKAQYNWGYDPQNYNVPDGSYSTNPHDGGVRINEFKQMVQAMHKSGLRVVMDVVYNHTFNGENSPFHQIAPYYYHRFRADGTWSDASACGNETASEKPMMRKYLIESLKYWVTEYHIDGFRFDLMAIHDTETMNLISAELHKIKSDIVLYGEGWTAGDSPLPVEKRALKQHAAQFDRIAAFSDDMRDGLKGWVFEAKDRGFVSGRFDATESTKMGIVAATKHPQIAYEKCRWTKMPWAAEPNQCVNYVECHDNHTLWDRLQNSNPDDSEADRIKMHKLAQTMVLTAQGVAFLHAGTEFLRTKNGEENSFKSSDDINKMDWVRRAKYTDVVTYYQKVIAMRKAHPAFRMTTAADIQKNLLFFDDVTEGVIAYTLDGAAVGDSWKRIVVIHNGNKTAQRIKIPIGKWRIVLDGDTVDEKSKRDFQGSVVTVGGISTLILVE